MSRTVTFIFHPCICMDMDVGDDFDAEEFNRMSDSDILHRYGNKMREDIGEWRIMDIDDIEVEE